MEIKEIGDNFGKLLKIGGKSEKFREIGKLGKGRKLGKNLTKLSKTEESGGTRRIYGGN